MEELRLLISGFLQKVPKGKIIDAHTVISYLEKNHGDIYLDGYQRGESEATYHSRISREIDEFDKIMLSRISDESYSENINGNLSSNACWKKI